jgi:dipeptidyl aminopeptidase/acylaminoacyl peptidase
VALAHRRGRAAEGGRTTLVAHDGAQTADLLAGEANVRTTVHEYGGGAFVARGGTVWYCNFEDQRVYRQDPSSDPFPITPEPAQRWGERYADLSLSPDGQVIVAVRERHRDGDVERAVVAMSPDGGDAPRVITTGRDFYAAPRISRDGTRLAWIAWDHPQMPWDGTELWVADLPATGDVGAQRQRVAGSPEQAVTQPTWAPDGSLWFVNDPDGWWNLFRMTPDGDVEPMTTEQVEYGWPQWQFGVQSFGFLDDGRVVAIANDAGVQHIVTMDPGSSPSRAKLPYTAIPPHLATDGRNVVFVGGTPSAPMAVARWDPITGEADVLRAETTFSLHPDDVSAARAIEFPTEGGMTAHAFFYPPRNRRISGSGVALPPLVVMSHGGPTSQSPASFDLAKQYWTTRGIAVVDVNYGGSTGYGRAYRERLKGRWGLVDVEDCVNAARFLADSGLVERDRMAIRGGSAGGYTTLCALTFSDVFAAGASYFGVADPKLLAEHTHDFESRYLDGLIGPLPEADELYRARSPIHHTERLTTPVIVLQGLEDAVVPPEQAERMVAALAERGIPHAYIAFPGEQHGFRRAESIVKAQESELAFYGQVMGFTPEGIEPIELSRG